MKGETVAAFGSPEEIFDSDTIDRLYDIRHGSYNLLFGSVELTKPQGEPRVFLVGGGGFGAPVYRSLQKRQIPFATGILYENDVDLQIARELSDCLVTAPAFEPMTEAQYNAAWALIRRCGRILDAGTPVGTQNALNGKLLETAAREGIPVLKAVSELPE